MLHAQTTATIPGERAAHRDPALARERLLGEAATPIARRRAGKSTLVKILDGIIEPDAGVIGLARRAVTVASARDAKRASVTATPAGTLPTVAATIAHRHAPAARSRVPA